MNRAWAAGKAMVMMAISQSDMKKWAVA